MAYQFVLPYLATDSTYNMVNAQFKSNVASFLYGELQSKVTEQVLAFVCNSVDTASLDTQLKDPYLFPRRIAAVSLAEVLTTDLGDARRHYTADLFDEYLVPIGSIRIYLNGECRLLRDASEESMLAYKARIGLL